MQQRGAEAEMKQDSDGLAASFFELAARMQGKVEGKICPESGKVPDWKRKVVTNCMGCFYYLFEDKLGFGFCANGDQNNEYPGEEEGRER